MFQTLSRRNRSLVDQQLSLIDRLERNEEDPDRLESLFRLDHLAARMRRNGANLLVLAGARIPRERADPVPVTGLVNAAASEVEDYTRVITAGLPDSEIAGAVAGDLVHLLAELLDNALRYSPPTSQVTVSAVPTGDGGLALEVRDSGLGMTEPDLRVANTRLRSGGEVNPYTARHMGLFVVGRLAAQHGLEVRLRSTVAGDPASGTTAGVYVPAEQVGAASAPVRYRPTDEPAADPHAGSATAPALAEPQYTESVQQVDEIVSVADVQPVELLPQRQPGTSGIAAEPVEAPGLPAAPPAPTNGHSRHAARDDSSDDTIYQKMLSEWLVDPHELSYNTDLNWQSVWDNGWSAAAAAESAPVLDHTPEGLPVRQPGARLVPGAAEDTTDEAANQRNGAAQHDNALDQPVASANDEGSGGGRSSRPSRPGPRGSPRQHRQALRRRACRPVPRPEQTEGGRHRMTDRSARFAGLAGVRFAHEVLRGVARDPGVGRRAAGGRQRAHARRAGRPARRGRLRPGQSVDGCRAAVRRRVRAAVGRRDGERIPAADAGRRRLEPRDAGDPDPATSARSATRWRFWSNGWAPSIQPRAAPRSTRERRMDRRATGRQRTRRRGQPGTAVHADCWPHRASGSSFRWRRRSDACDIRGPAPRWPTQRRSWPDPAAGCRAPLGRRDRRPSLVATRRGAGADR